MHIFNLFKLYCTIARVHGSGPSTKRPTDRKRWKFTNFAKEISRKLTKNLLHSMAVFKYSESY